MAKQELSYEIKLILVLVLLFVLYPVGLILMFRWMKWPTWVKLLIALPILLAILGFLGAMILGFSGVINPSSQIEKAEEQRLESANKELICTKQCAALDTNVDTCVQKCIQNLKTAK